MTQSLISGYYKLNKRRLRLKLARPASRSSQKNILSKWLFILTKARRRSAREHLTARSELNEPFSKFSAVQMLTNSKEIATPNINFHSENLLQIKMASCYTTTHVCNGRCSRRLSAHAPFSVTQLTARNVWLLHACWTVSCVTESGGARTGLGPP